MLVLPQLSQLFGYLFSVYPYLQIQNFFNQKLLIFFLFLNENICCGYSLEVPWLGSSNEYHSICFCQEIRKIFSQYPLLSVDM